jgi:alkanesulfonate monooxygenase SsuD/methylene tetrahydromethanopterin reductase-like flavin-dependent oxidoreductase (luciferase family)
MRDELAIRPGAAAPSSSGASAAFGAGVQFSAMPLGQLLEQSSAGRAAITGTPDEVIAQLRTYIAAGVDELVIQWFDPADVEGLQFLAEEVLPPLAAS